MGKKPPSRRPYTPPPPCAVPYGSEGEWTEESSRAARGCVLSSLHAQLEWWRSSSCKHAPAEAPLDVDATLCRLKAASPRSVLSNMLLLSSTRGILSAAILIDPSDERGPMRHWPARPIAALQQLSELQHAINAGKHPSLPDFVAVLNPHDSPYQGEGGNWCGLAPILSNSRVMGEHRDLLMPDFSFAPLSYLTNMLEANMSASLAVPRGWSAEREAIYAAGKRLRWAQKQRSLFWRGGETHVQRRMYAEGFTQGKVKLAPPLRADVVLCGAHCSLEQGWWSAGLQEGVHYLSSKQVEDLPRVAATADAQQKASALLASRGSDYTYHILAPSFITEYWHALLWGYASLYNRGFASSPTSLDAAAACSLRHRSSPQNEKERLCMRGVHGNCQFKLIGREGLVPIPTPSEMAAECNSTARMQALYRRFALLLPMRLTGGTNVSEAAVAALHSWLKGDHRKAPREAGKPSAGATARVAPKLVVQEPN